MVISMQTHLYEFHKKNGRLIDYAGFEMPVWYDGIISEHLAVRNSVGIFDVTHMGRCLVEGKDSTAFLDYISTRDIASLNIQQGRYSVMCNEKGGIVDDIVVFRLGKNQFLVIYNAINHKKDLAWMNKHAENFEVKIRDVSNEVAMFAIQGPKAAKTLQPIVNVDLSDLRYFRGKWAFIKDKKILLTRTSYTGEDGFEIFLWNTPLSDAKKATELWQNLLASGQAYGIKPCGLGARDTLRMETGLCLYGNDITEEITPLEARLDFAVNFEKTDFLGKEALLREQNDGIGRIRVGIRALSRGIPRSGNTIWFGEKEVGNLTSGTFSPLLKCGIGIGYVPTECKFVGTEVDLGGKRSFVRAIITETPFYDETKYGRKRNLAYE